MFPFNLYLGPLQCRTAAELWQLWTLTVVPNLSCQPYLPNLVHQRPVSRCFIHIPAVHRIAFRTQAQLRAWIAIGAHAGPGTLISGYTLTFMKLQAGTVTLLYTTLTGYELTQEHCYIPRSRTGYELKQWLLATLTRVTSWRRNTALGHAHGWATSWRNDY